MSVLDGAGKVVGKGDMKLVPEGATSVKAQGSATGWSLVFETPDGTIEAHIGDMERAVKLAMRLSRQIAKEARKA